MKVKVWLETGLAGISFEDEFEISDDATEKEIEATAKEIAFDRIDWGYEVEDPFSRGEDAGSSRCSFEIIDDLKKLDEPQKVKVPAFVAEWFEENKHNLNFAIYELCEAGKVPVDLYEGLTDFERWFYLNHDIDTLIRMQDGYEVEEEPKWIVKDTRTAGMYFKGIVGISVDGQFSNSWSQREGCIKFSDKEKAEAVATLTGGTVEKV